MDRSCPVSLATARMATTDDVAPNDLRRTIPG